MTTTKLIAFAPGPNCNDSLRSKAAKFLRISETTGMCCLRCAGCGWLFEAIWYGQQGRLVHWRRSSSDQRRGEIRSVRKGFPSDVFRGVSNDGILRERMNARLIDARVLWDFIHGWHIFDIYVTLYCFMESFSTICGLKSDILRPGSELSQKKLQACWGIRTCSNCSNEGLQLERQSNNRNHFFTRSVPHLFLVVAGCFSVSFSWTTGKEMFAGVFLQTQKRNLPCIHHWWLLPTSDSQSPRQLGIPLGREASVAKMPSNSNSDGSCKLNVSQS